MSPDSPKCLRENRAMHSQLTTTALFHCVKYTRIRLPLTWRQGLRRSCLYNLQLSSTEERHLTSKWPLKLTCCSQGLYFIAWSLGCSLLDKRWCPIRTQPIRISLLLKLDGWTPRQHRLVQPRWAGRSCLPLSHAMKHRESQLPKKQEWNRHSSRDRD